jgi:hypothetical protein
VESIKNYKKILVRTVPKTHFIKNLIKLKLIIPPYRPYLVAPKGQFLEGPVNKTFEF